MANTLTDEQIAVSHLTDDYERMRTAALDSDRRANALMVDAIMALDNNNPTVAREFLERALTANGRAIVVLRDGVSA